MNNVSLDRWLPKDGYDHQRGNLTFIQRLNIALDVASALDYLHHHCQTPIVHHDLKPSNILLDDDMIAHVGDFGLARFLSKVAQNISLGVKGSIGYIAPEYAMDGKASTQGDVYSYGILPWEMITGKGPTDDMFKDNLSLHHFVKLAFSE
ncbi:probable LRR receptor-like serine/threonine-protein kinase At3g47570 [Magnolia sinica]|uniref:probable LRR receptor-like serine/threonine-protein kinase At3g47570 n=1 Tax=Magnolia sinica TaxID=86752 RepID=UPI0026597294|nr:probable LRR receptor-like serine/threonine-protein kinase At3g47570 [Magnolia sinica]